MEMQLVLGVTFQVFKDAIAPSAASVERSEPAPGILALLTSEKVHCRRTHIYSINTAQCWDRTTGLRTIGALCDSIARALVSAERKTV